MIHIRVHGALACNQHRVTLQTIPGGSEPLFSLRGNVARLATSTWTRSAMDDCPACPPPLVGWRVLHFARPRLTVLRPYGDLCGLACGNRAPDRYTNVRAPAQANRRRQPGDRVHRPERPNDIRSTCHRCELAHCERPIGHLYRRNVIRHTSRTRPDGARTSGHGHCRGVSGRTSRPEPAGGSIYHYGGWMPKSRTGRYGSRIRRIRPRFSRDH